MIDDDGSAIAAYVDAAAVAMGLPLAPDQRAGVIRYFALAASMAAIVEAVDLGPHDESAVRFEPVGPVPMPGGKDAS